MSTEEVHCYQRARLYGGMIEAISQRGYSAVTVADVLDLSGVSRRAFYEHFAGKRECFLAVCCMIADRFTARIFDTCSSARGSLDDRLHLALQTLVSDALAEPEPTRLLLVEAQAVGLTAAPQMHLITTELEQRIARVLAHEPDGARIPWPVAKGILGGLQRLLYLRLRDCSAEELAGEVDALASEMVRWMMLFSSPTRDLAVEADHGAQGSHRGLSVTGVGEPLGERERLFKTILTLAVEGRSYERPVWRIVEKADIHPKWFRGRPNDGESFAGEEDCFLTAFEQVSCEIISLLQARLGADDPQATHQIISPAQVHRALLALMNYLSARPLYAQTLSVGAFVAGPRATERNVRLSRELVSTLVAGLSAEKPEDCILDAVAGAVWHMIGYWASGLPDEDSQMSVATFTDHMTYVVLTPFIGAKRAIDAIGLGDQAPCGARDE
jgi:AcrR family transcriptional regulator